MANYIVLDGDKAVFNIDETQFSFIRTFKELERRIQAVEEAKRAYAEERKGLEEALDSLGSSVGKALDGIKKAIPELIE